MATAKDNKPWEAETAPTQTSDATAAMKAAEANPDPDLQVLENPDPAPVLSETVSEEVKSVEAPAVVLEEVADPTAVIHAETPAAGEKPAQKVVVSGPQAPLALINLVSRGMSMSAAKKKLGL